MGPNKFAGKRILIYGFAREGASTLRYLRKHLPQQKIYITDDKVLNDIPSEYRTEINSDKNVEFIEGIDTKDSLNGQFDVVFKTPGKPNKSLPIAFRRIITSQTQVFLEECRGVVIGVTGTKGKSTTASLIAEILQAAGKKSVLLGNIGKPPLDFLEENNGPETYFVFEMSSHQLSTVNKSPHIAVLLNFYPEHLDYYESLDDYASAKAKITQFQNHGDYLVFNEDDPVVKKIGDNTKAIKVPFGLKYLPEIEKLGPVRLTGQMNQLNTLAALKVSEILHIPRETAWQAVKSFQPLEHRLELVGTFKGVTFYNDSIATIPEATIAALDTLGDRVETLFVGGFDRGVAYPKLAERILESHVKNLILLPGTGEKIWQEIRSVDHSSDEKYTVARADNLEDAVKSAYHLTKPGKIALLSPAATSFNLFKDYRDRGRQFKEWVARLGKTA